MQQFIGRDTTVLATGTIHEEVHASAHGRVSVRLLERASPTRGRILFVNGAFATMSGNRWAERELVNHDILSFDYPAMGASRSHNDAVRPLSKEDEAEILVELVERYRPAFLFSVSWGGMAALLALSGQPAPIRRAVVGSFSARVTERLAALSARGIAAAERGDMAEAADVLLAGLGTTFPAKVQRAYRDYFAAFDAEQIAYGIAQMRTIVTLDPTRGEEGASFRAALGRIEVPVLFVNGALDEHTPPHSILPMEAMVRRCGFAEIPDAGHFIPLDGPAPRRALCRAIDDWLM